jgi:hypothetical protein
MVVGAPDGFELVAELEFWNVNADLVIGTRRAEHLNAADQLFTVCAELQLVVLEIRFGDFDQVHGPSQTAVIFPVAIGAGNAFAVVACVDFDDDGVDAVVEFVGDLKKK